MSQALTADSNWTRVTIFLPVNVPAELRARLECHRTIRMHYTWFAFSSTPYSGHDVSVAPKGIQKYCVVTIDVNRGIDDPMFKQDLNNLNLKCLHHYAVCRCAPKEIRMTATAMQRRSFRLIDILNVGSRLP
jgi:hypothetical protein